MAISDWISVGISPPRCSCSLDRSCPRGAFCSRCVLDRVFSVECWFSRRGPCSVAPVVFFAFSSGVVLFSSFRHPVWRLEVFRFRHCFSDLLFTHRFLLYWFRPSISMVFVLVLAPADVPLSESGFFCFGGVGNIKRSGTSALFVADYDAADFPRCRSRPFVAIRIIDWYW